MDTFTCQPPAVELPIWVKWDHGMVEGRIVKRKDGSGVRIKDVATVVERLFEEERKSPVAIRHMTVRVALGWFEVY